MEIDAFHQWWFLRPLLFVVMVVLAIGVAVLIGWWGERREKRAAQRANQPMCDCVVASARPWSPYDDKSERHAA